MVEVSGPGVAALTGPTSPACGRQPANDRARSCVMAPRGRRRYWPERWPESVCGPRYRRQLGKMMARRCQTHLPSTLERAAERQRLCECLAAAGGGSTLTRCAHAGTSAAAIRHLAQHVAATMQSAHCASARAELLNTRRRLVLGLHGQPVLRQASPGTSCASHPSISRFPVRLAEYRKTGNSISIEAIGEACSPAREPLPHG
jgi:hypothetical protein